MQRKFITTTQAAERTGLSARYVQRLAADGRITGAMKVGPVWLVPESFKWKPQKRGPKPRT